MENIEVKSIEQYKRMDNENNNYHHNYQHIIKEEKNS